MKYCPVCHQPDTAGYGICRDCNQIMVEDHPEERTKAQKLLDRFGEWFIRMVVALLTVGVGFHIGQSLGSVMFPYSSLAPVAAIGFGTAACVVASFLLGLKTGKWLYISSAVTGALLAFVPFMVIEWFDQSLLQKSVIFLLCASAAIVALISGKAYRQNSEKVYITLPIVWAVVVILVSAVVG